MGNIIAAGIIIIILGSAITYIVKAKKNGVHCIGCPTGSTCGGSCASVAKEEVKSTGCGCATGTGCNCGEDSSCSCGEHK